MIRLNKYIADAGVCTRRKADELIKAGRIKVNDIVVTTLGIKVQKGDRVEYKGKILSCIKKHYILLNKPKGFPVISVDPDNKKTAINLVKSASEEPLFPVGELDDNTSGLLFFSNDMELIKRMSNPEKAIKEKYILQLDNELGPELLEQLQKGIKLKEGVLSFDKAHFGDKGENKKKLIIATSFGTKTIIYKLIEHLGYKVTSLDRVEFSALKKGPLTRGKWRVLTPKEIGYLKMIKGSS